jgi:hypothetical protein
MATSAAIISKPDWPSLVLSVVADADSSGVNTSSPSVVVEPAAVTVVVFSVLPAAVVDRSVDVVVSLSVVSVVELTVVVVVEDGAAVVVGGCVVADPPPEEDVVVVGGDVVVRSSSTVTVEEPLTPTIACSPKAVSSMRTPAWRLYSPTATSAVSTVAT